MRSPYDDERRALRRGLALAGLLLAAPSLACGASDGAGDDFGDSGGFGEAGTESGSASEGDASGGGTTTSDSSTSGGDGDGDDEGDTGEPPPPPEEEEEGDFEFPQASGRFVYAANETTDRVAVIDTEDLAIDVVSVSRGPTWVQPIASSSADAGSVAVLSPGSDELTFIRTTAAGVNSLELRAVAEGANALAASPAGDFVIAYHDIDIEAAPVGSDQEITVLSTAAGGPSYALAVGAHPRALEFAPDGSRAFVITDDGVNIIDLGEIADVDKPPLIPVIPDPALDPATVEIQVSASRAQALARVDEETWIAVTDLDDGSQVQLELPGFPTDVDVVADGSFALAVLPSRFGSSLVEIPLPPSTATDFTVAELGEEYVGVAQLGAAGEVALLYTTVDPWALDGEVGPLGDPRLRMTIARRNGGGWDDQLTMFTEVPIRAAGIAPDDANAILLHDEAPWLNSNAPWPYTLIDLAAQFPIRKVQQVQAKPKSVLFTPDGARAAVSIRNEAGSVRAVDLVSLGNFIVDTLPLGSPPQGLGHVEVTDKIFVSQEHGSGRITFVASDGSVQTATGFELNDDVKD